METSQTPVDKNSFNGIYLLPLKNQAPRRQKEFLITDSHSGSNYVSFEQLHPELFKKNIQVTKFLNSG